MKIDKLLVTVKHKSLISLSIRQIACIMRISRMKERSMELRLMELRKQAGYRNRDEFAKKIGVNRQALP